MEDHPDTFRKTPTNDAAKLRSMVAIKDKAQELVELLSQPGACDPRCMALARTKLEECVMWAVKAVNA